MIPNLDTDLLRAFVAVAETQSFTRAGERLLRTQAAVSMQVKRLEEIIGRRIFERDPRGVRLTGEGEVLLTYARQMLRLNDEALAALGRPGAGGVVRIGTPDDYASTLLPRALARFGDDFPHGRVEVVCGIGVELLPELHQGRLDLALVPRASSRPAGYRVRRERLIWVAAPDFAMPGDGPLPLALFGKGCVCRDLIVSALEKAAQPWRAKFTSLTIAPIHAAVQAGLAVTALEECTIPPGLRILGSESGLPELPPVDIDLHRASDEVSGLARHLGDIIVETLGPERRTGGCADLP